MVKTVETGTANTWNVHARVKRGGGFNSSGALGWEWFDLRITVDENVVIMWRGEQPPRNHGYESLPGLGATMTMDGNCNTCHGAARDTDFILSAPAARPALALTRHPSISPSSPRRGARLASGSRAISSNGGVTSSTR